MGLTKKQKKSFLKSIYSFSSKLLDRSIIVKGNCKVHRAVYDRLTEILKELRRIDNDEEVDSELTANITLISNLVDKLYMKMNI